ncbi:MULTISPECIES: lysophospholipid acyltransferase family protein [Cobetia]|uniref:Lysophospholipid acyltransferase family protein n=2 Tax=Halomonadaceae TaxID=28256 RepID=A0ABU9GHY9_COBMA|nr:MULTISPECIES: lysophospholipid acyltransferase family protein [Cobetia]MDA5565249.1 lysophospholipid acyltransferase family protein [Cobetia sp. MMG027]MDH2375196.1 lysophospholipid acyltransferase family protein [Cobetia sp. 3AK]MDI6005016.1 lysophospholipid acyltransferase family protein [Cobetia pacifica]GED42616.1 lysophosphatidic acid acyltransferase [Cobetia marina]
MNALRSVLFYFGYFMALLLSALVLVPVAACLPLKARYRVLHSYNHLVLWWFRLTCGVRVEVSGREQLPEGACVLLSNHQSEWETIYLQVVKRPLCTVLKQELLKIPVFGWGLKLLEPIPLDRKQPAKALKQVLSVGTQRLKDGFTVLIFPEGTRLAPGTRKKFNKSGAAIACRAGVPVVPVAHNAGEIWPNDSWIKRSGTLHVVFGPAIETTGRKPDAVIADVEGWVEDTLQRISRTPRPPLEEKAPADSVGV